MNKRYLNFFASLCFLTFTQLLDAQCNGSRYHDFVFPSPPTLTSNITYGSNITGYGTPQNLLLDIYQPNGDSSTNRPLLIMAHGGVFVAGSKTGSDIVPLCKDFARLGYVVASIDYRMGISFSFSSVPDSSNAAEEIIRATQDARAAVRFFRKNVAVGGNTYNIDTNTIFFGGVSAGAFMALNLAYLNNVSELPAYIDTTQNGLSGGIEGNSGNPGYSSNVKAIVNICGAILDTSWIQAPAIPLLSMHGDSDHTVPYGTSKLILEGLYPLMTVNGSHSITARANHVGVQNCFDTYVGQAHIPHSHDSLYYDTTLVIMRNFLEHFICNVPLDCNYTSTPSPLGINNLEPLEANINVYPNPAESIVTIDLSAFEGSTINIELYNQLGCKVKNINNIKTQQYKLSRNNLPSGIYFINIIAKEKTHYKKIIFE